MTDKLIIRTSDRGNFKRCRMQWEFGSKIRMNYEKSRVGVALRFGTAVHAGLEEWYNPVTWDKLKPSGRAHLAMTAFHKAWPKPASDDPEEFHTEWQEYSELGVGMLNNYFDYSVKYDDFKPVYAEIEFEVPIPFSPEQQYDNPKFESRDEYLWYRGMPVVYQGRIDLIVQDDHDRYWIWDHKTAGRFDSTEWLALDDQVGSYAWAIQQQLGITIAGITYNELAKEVAKPPKVLKNGSLSQDKRQITTEKIYRETLAQQGLSVVGYEEYLSYLAENPRQFIRRTQVHRSQRELQIIGERILAEAIEMLDSPSIYPTPSKFNCTGCDFFQACIARNDGSDYQWILDSSNFINRANA